MYREKLEKAARNAAKTAASIDCGRIICCDRASMQDEIINLTVSEIQVQVFGENSGYSLQYKNGVFTTKGFGYGNNFSVKMPFAAKMSFDGAVVRKCNEASMISASEKAQEMARKMAEYVRSLPCEPYMNTYFARGWIVAAAQEYALHEWAEQNKWEKPIDENISIKPANDLGNSYNALYGTEFHAYDLYIVQETDEGTNILEHYPMDESMRKIVTEAVEEKASEAERMMAYKPDGILDFQEKSEQVMNTLPLAALKVLDEAIQECSWADKRELDARIKEETSSIYAEFMYHALPYAEHFIKTNELMPEINFDFSYATSPSPSAPEHMFTRFSNAKAVFSNELAQEFREKEAEIVRIAKYIEHTDQIRSGVMNDMVSCIQKITPEQAENGFEQALEENLTKSWQNQDELYNASDNNTCVSILFDESGNIYGIQAEGKYTETILYGFQKEEAELVCSSVCELFEKFENENIETGEYEEMEEMEEEAEEISA